MRRLLLLIFCVFGMQLTGLAVNQDSVRAMKWVETIRPILNTEAQAAKIYLDSLHDFLLIHPNLQRPTAEYHKQMGIYYFRSALYDSSFVHYRKSYSAFQSLQESLESAKILVNMSMIYNRQGIWDSTTAYATQALEIFEMLEDHKGISICTNIIGQVFHSNHDFEKAIQYFRRYLLNAQVSGDTLEMAGGNNNLGSCFYSIRKYDSAEVYHLRALALANAIDAGYAKGNALQNLGNTYEKTERAAFAKDYYVRALAVYREINFTSGILEVNTNLGGFLARNNRGKEAIPYLEEALAMAREKSETRLEVEILPFLTASYEQTGDFRNAYFTQVSFQELSDSLFNEDIQTSVAEINAKYETEKKDREIAQLNLTNALNETQIARNQVIIFGLSGLAVLILLALLLIRASAKQRQTALILAQERTLRETRLQVMMESQEHERQRFATDLHDHIGQLLSALRLNITQLRAEPGQPLPEQPYLNSLQLVSEMQTEIRRTISDLMPPVLSREGLGPALQDLAKRISSPGNLAVDCTVWGLENRLSTQLEISLFRVVQEWSHNVMKYANASQLFIQLGMESGLLTLMMEDDGEGFDAAELEKGNGFGWKNIQTRLDLVQATLELDTRPGRKGTNLTVSVQV